MEIILLPNFHNAMVTVFAIQKLITLRKEISFTADILENF